MAKGDSDKPGQVSDEADKQQLKAAQEQGEAYSHALEEMKDETGKGRTKKLHDYIISLTEEEAEGMYQWDDGQLVWRNPTDENAHFEVAVRDAHDKRFVPYLDVDMKVADHDGRVLISRKLPFLWHSWLHHYGANVRLPGDGAYNVEINVGPLRLMRHDKQNGGRFTKMANVRFENFAVSTGQKLS